ncbi:hypothetical protein GCM10007086_37930 [Photobacterium aphoticum]|nr:hypothetical protein GCM10007086_37930 [Photobacterium aphoticum]
MRLIVYIYRETKIPNSHNLGFGIYERFLLFEIEKNTNQNRVDIDENNIIALIRSISLCKL